MLGKKMSLESRLKMSLSRKGRVLSEDWRKKISEGRKRFILQNPNWKKEMSVRFRGGNSNFWKGGLTEKSKIERSSSKYKDWRKAVFMRDNWTCQECKVRGGLGLKVILNADHIKPFSTFPELRYQLDNGRTLCLPCHRQTPTWGGESKFKKKQNV